MRTARRLGYGVVAVYSDADRDALHVREADEAVRIGEALPAQSYLRIEAIIAAAKASGADAVHPGYGFLAENEDFAQACRDAGLVFIGPSPEAIKAMGNKAGAKEIMQAAGVPCVPGYQGADQSDAVMLAEASKIGFPVMIKAVAGGGGRGMRLVADAAAFPDALRSARSEAQGAFGDPTVILERAIVDPRHIEIQVFGDRYGKAIHLGERDCSVQRRHQKLIEEAPSPAVSPELRARMGAIAVAAIKSIGYEGAGTLEFLLDASGEFYFMEMNTRLQVEHPVTEAITGPRSGRTAVARRRRRAARASSRRTSNSPATPSRCGCARRMPAMISCRSRAGWRCGRCRMTSASSMRCNPAPRFRRSTISMIAKLISHGATRDEARRKLIHGLEQTAAFGVTTNQAFLAACLRHPGVRGGRSDHGFHRQASRRSAGAAQGRRPEAALAALLLYVTDRHAPLWQSGRTLAATFPLPVRVELDHGVHDLEIVRERDGSYRGLEDTRVPVRDRRASKATPSALARNGLMESGNFFRDGDRLYFLHRGVTLSVRDLTLRCTGLGCRHRRRRQGARGDERPRRRGSGQAGRARRGRPAGDDAGSHENGTCAYRAGFRHDFRDRRRGRRAGDDREDRGGDRGAEHRQLTPAKRSEKQSCRGRMDCWAFALPASQAGRIFVTTRSAPSPH